MIGIDIVDIALDAGNLSEFDDTSTGSAAVAVSAGAAQAGTAYGLAIDTDAGIAVRFKKALAWGTAELRMRVHIDPNGVVLADSVARRLFSLLDGPNTSYGGIQLRDSGGGAHQVRASVRHDAGGDNTTSWYSISDGPHWIELRIVRASSATASDGTLALWIDGVKQEESGGLDIFDVTRPTDAAVEWTSPNAADTGTLYVDELIVRNEDVEIGQVELSAVLARAGVEDGSSGEFDIFTSHADMNVNAVAALAGSRRGVSFTADNGTSLEAGQLFSRVWTSRVLRWRFHLDPNGVSLADTDERKIGRLTVDGVDRVYVALQSDGTGGYELSATLTLDSGSAATTPAAISDTDHAVEVVVRRATSAVASDGELELWVDGTLLESATGLDLFDQTRPTDARLTWLGGSASDAGVVYQDELEVRDTDATIGSAVRAERGIVGITIDGAAVDYVPGTASHNTQIGPSPSSFSFETRAAVPDTGAVVVTRTWKDNTGNVNRVETMFTGKVLEVEPAEIGNSGIYETLVICADDRHEAADTFITKKIPEQASESTLAKLKDLLPGSWNLNAEAGPSVGPMNLQDAPFPQAAAQVSRDAGQVFWIAPSKFIHSVAPDAVDGSVEINREDADRWGRFDYRRSPGKVANRIIVRGDEGTSVTVNDAASQDVYGTRPMVFSAHSVKKDDVLTRIGETLATGHRVPIVEGTIKARFDRISVGDNIRVTDLQLRLRGFKVRVTQISEQQLGSHEWEQAITFTSERLLPKLVPPRPDVELPAIRARGPNLNPPAPIKSEPPRVVHRGPIEGPDKPVAPSPGEYIAQLRIDQDGGIVRLGLDSTHVGALVEQGFKVELISRNVLTVSTSTVGASGGEDIEVWNNGSHHVTVVSAVGGEENRWTLNDQAKRVDITVTGAYKGARVIVTLFDGDVGSGLSDVLDAFFYGTEEMLSKESIRRDVIFEARLQATIPSGAVIGGKEVQKVIDQAQEGSLGQGFYGERNLLKGDTELPGAQRTTMELRSEDGVSVLVDPATAAIGGALAREPGGPPLNKALAKANASDPDDLDAVPESATRKVIGSGGNGNLDEVKEGAAFKRVTGTYVDASGRIQQLRRPTSALDLDPEQLMDLSREDSDDIIESATRIFMNASYADGSRRPVTMRKEIGAVDLEGDDMYDLLIHDLSDVADDPAGLWRKPKAVGSDNRLETDGYGANSMTNAKVSPLALERTSMADHSVVGRMIAEEVVDEFQTMGSGLSDAGWDSLDPG